MHKVVLISAARGDAEPPMTVKNLQSDRGKMFGDEGNIQASGSYPRCIRAIVVVTNRYSSSIWNQVLDNLVLKFAG